MTAGGYSVEAHVVRIVAVARRLCGKPSYRLPRVLERTLEPAEEVGRVVDRRHEVARLPHPAQEAIHHADRDLITMDPRAPVKKDHDRRGVAGELTERLVDVEMLIPED